MKRALFSGVLLCAASLAQPGNDQFAKDIPQRLAKLMPVHMPFHTDGLSKREVAEVRELVHALQLLDDIYWRQIDPAALELYSKLRATSHLCGDALPFESNSAMKERYPWDEHNPATHSNATQMPLIESAHACYLLINGSRYDLFQDNAPFVSSAPNPQPPGKNFYQPFGSFHSAKELEEYAAAHARQKTVLYSSTTVVKRKGNELVTVPYHVEYAQWLIPAAESLRRAAALSDDPAFSKFLRMRADALISDDYYASDLQWLDLKSPKIDIIYAPYETYSDGLLGVKGSFGASILIRNEEESRKLELFQKYVADIQDALPVAAEYKPSKKGHLTPMEVADAPFRAGDLLHGYQAVADNLPNDPRVHQARGTKKIFFKNFMDARVNEVVLPTAKQVMVPEQAAIASARGYLYAVMMHEICHGLGPDFATGKRDIREAIGPGYAALEEAKADVVGMYGLGWLIEHGALPKEQRAEYDASYVAGIFRSVRFGAGEPHSRAEMMEFNYLAEQGAITRTSEGRYRVVEEKLAPAIASLSKQLLEIEATGDRERNDRWFAKYGAMPSDLKQTLDKVTGVPIDITPIFDFPVDPH